MQLLIETILILKKYSSIHRSLTICNNVFCMNLKCKLHTIVCIVPYPPTRHSILSRLINKISNTHSNPAPHFAYPLGFITESSPKAKSYDGLPSSIRSIGITEISSCNSPSPPLGYRIHINHCNSSLIFHLPQWLFIGKSHPSL